MTARSGRRFAKWVDRKTKRTRKEPLNADGDRVTVEAVNYLIAYFDADGKRQEVNSGTSTLRDGRTNRGATERGRYLAEDGHRER